MLFSSKKEERCIRKARASRGAVAVMAMLIVVVMAILFQAYMTHVLSDMKTGQTFDEVAQYNGERMAIGNLVKEAVLQYYERPRVGQAVPATVKELVEDYLAQIDATGVTYSVSSIGSFPVCSVANTSFWPLKIPDASTAGAETTISGDFNLYSELVPADLSKSRIAEYSGASTETILAVRNKTNDIFPITVTRTEGGKSVEFDYYLRMYQVPVTNFNLISYAITDKGADIPASPPVLGAGIDLSKVSSLALSQMDATSSIGQTIAYPYMYRELFSAAASVWEYALYNNSSNVNYMVTEVMPTSQRKYIYMLSDPYVGDVSRIDVSGNVISCSNPDSTGAYKAQTGRDPTGFDPVYYYNTTLVDIDGYRVTEDGGEIIATGEEVGIRNADATTPTDSNGDGVINRIDATRFCPTGVYPNQIDWTFDLEKIQPITISGTVAKYRYIYVHLPDSVPSGVESHITITDSSHGTASTPVIICIEGWSRVNKIITTPSATIPDNYEVYLDGDLTDQQVMLYVVGADVLLDNDCKMDGLMFFDDKLAGFSRAPHKFAFRGLFAWNGDSASIGIDEDDITVNPLPAGTDNQFRSIAPRFLLVDVRSETIIP